MKKELKFQLFFCTAYGNRTRHSSVKGMRLNRLTNAAFPFWECKDRERDISTKKNLKIFLAYPDIVT
jgi:hypothetical protein